MYCICLENEEKITATVQNCLKLWNEKYDCLATEVRSSGPIPAQLLGLYTSWRVTRARPSTGCEAGRENTLLVRSIGSVLNINTFRYEVW